MRGLPAVGVMLILSGTLICSCTSNDKIIGKWVSASPVNCTDANIIKGGKIEWTFDKKRICEIKYILGAGGQDETRSYRNYRVKGDSIYWDVNLPVDKRGINAAIRFVSSDSVELKYRLPSGCIELYKLKKIKTK